jgi:hypothetical protein
MSKRLRPEPCSNPLLTDLYQLNMIEAYLTHGKTQTAVFEFFVRKLPERRGFLMAALLSALLGLGIQGASRATLLRLRVAKDTKDLVGVASFRVAAIFGIALGLIFSSSNSHHVEVRKDVQEETRLWGTLYVLAASLPLDTCRSIRAQLRLYHDNVANEIERPEAGDQRAVSTTQSLFRICRQLAVDESQLAQSSWDRTEFGRSCSKLMDARGNRRIAMLEEHVKAPFWIFLTVSFSFLAILFGAFDWKVVNLIFSSLFYIAVGVTAALIYAMSDPYHEPGKISPLPVEEWLATADRDAMCSKDAAGSSKAETQE